jgi:very-short-patch-repair endonuclease
MAAEHDAIRDAYLEKQGVRVLRFENWRVFEDLEFALGVIRENFEMK